MKKSYLLFCGVLLIGAAHASTAKADDYSYLTVAYTDAEQSHELASLQKITFAGGQMQAVNTSGTATEYDLSTLEKLYFAATPTAINGTPVDGVRVSYDAESAMLAVEGASGATVQVYNLSGTLALSVKLASESEKISLAELPKSIYLVRVGSQVIKIKR